MPKLRFQNRIDNLAFRETFNVLTSTRGRGGDLSSAIWATARFTPDGVITPRPNHVRTATIPSGIRSTFLGGTLVFPPDDYLIQDPSGARAARLMSAIVIQEYGHCTRMPRQPFDFANRTGVIRFTVDAWAQGILGTYVTVDITEEPVPCTSFGILQNVEPGPRPNKAIMLQLSEGDTSLNTVGPVLVYDNYAMTTVSPSFTVTGGSRLAVSPGSLNLIEIRLSTTNITVYGSDYSTDDGVTFPNFRKIYEATISLPFTRGYIHFGERNHSTTKFDFPETSVYYWGLM